MASSSFALRLSSVHKTPNYTKPDDPSTSLSSVFKPLLKDLRHAPLILNVSRAVNDTYRRKLDTFVDSVFLFVDQPYLQSQRNFAPIKEIGHAVVIGNIEGKIPTTFPPGVYIRNGPNPLFGGLKSAVSLFGKSSSVWIEGEGMLHALYFTKDTDQDHWTVSYNNKYVVTDTFKQEKKQNKPSFLPALYGDSQAIIAAILINVWRFGKAYKCSSNTSVFEHSGKLYSITESHMPHEIDLATLETNVGEWDVEKSWGRPFTSHPKKAPGTGELVIIGAGTFKPFIELGVISADGEKLLHKVDLKFNRSIICHEIGVTQKYNIIIDIPLIVDIKRLVKGGPLIKFEKEEYAAIGVMPRYGDGNSIRWFEVVPHCTVHIFNCFEDGNEVVVRGSRARGSKIPGPDFGRDEVEWFSRGIVPVVQFQEDADNNLEVGELFSCPYEWRLNMETGEVKEKNLTRSSLSMDFPLINEKYTGVKNNYGYTQVVDLTASSISGRAKHGMLAKLYFQEPEAIPSKMMEHFESEELIKVEYHKFEENNFCSGATFVSKDGGDEDDGWIVCFVHNEETDVSQVHVIDTHNFEAEPVAKITLPQRVPYGFHGAYFSTPT